MNSPILLGSIASIISTASLILSIVIFALVALGVFLAVRRGLLRSALRLTTLIITIVLALLGAMFLKDTLGALIEGLLSGVLSGDRLNSVTESSPTLSELIAGLPGALAGPFVFLFLFIILNVIFVIAYNLLKRIPIFKITVGNKLVDRILGGVVGAICSLLLVSCFMIPFAGYVNVADNVLTNVEHTDLSEESAKDITDIHENYVTPLANNAALTVSDTLLGSVVFENLFSCEIKGESVNLVNEIAYLTKTYTTITPLVDVDFELSEFDKEQGDALRKFASDFDESAIVPHILCEILPSAANKWNHGEEFVGVSNPTESVPENMQSLMGHTVAIMETTTDATLKNDLVTLCELIATMAENGTLATLSSASSNEILMTLSDPGVVSGLVDILNANEHTQILVGDLTAIGMDAIIDSMELPEIDDELRDQIMDDLNAAIESIEHIEGYDAQVEALSGNIADVLAEHGTTATDEELKLYAETIIGYGPELIGKE